MDERRLELKVGAMVLAALAAVGLLLVALGELGAGGDARVSVDFGYAGGLPTGAPVKLAGVKIGRVRSVLLHPARRDERGRPLPVRVIVDLDPASLPGLKADAHFSVATQGPLGEPYLEAQPGSAGAPDLARGAEVRGDDPPRIDLLTARLYDFLDAATAAIGDDPEAVRTLFVDLASLTRNADGALTTNRPKIDAAIGDLSTAAADLREITAYARGELRAGGKADQLLADSATVAASLKRDLPGLTEKADRTLGSAQTVVGSFDADDAARIKSAIARYEAAGQRMDEVAVRADRLLARVEQGEGTLGGLATDPAVYQDLKALLTDLKQHPWKLLWKGD